MTLAGWLQIILVFAIVIAAAWPLGLYMARLFGRPELLPAEGGLYRLAGIDPKREQSWMAYALAMLLFNFIGFVVLYLLQRLQFYLPLDPQGFSGTSEHLAFNTAWSFPEPVFDALAKRFPTLTFECVCFDEGWGLAGKGRFGVEADEEPFTITDANDELYELVYGHPPEREDEEA